MSGARYSPARLLFLLPLVLAVTIIPEDGHTRVKRIVGGKPAELPPRIASNSTTSTTTAAPQTTSTPSTTTPSTTTTLRTTSTPGNTAAPGTGEPPEDPLVFVRRDRRRAVVNGVHNPDGTVSFLGLRYAEPPVKRFRFQRPRKQKLKGVINAQQYGPPCPQWYKGRLIGNEDCLFLNIYTPQVPLGSGRPPPRLPVLIWIHGGNFQSGSASQYLPRDIVKRGVVVVTVQYRLGSLGFLSLGRKELPGNVGLFDIATATRWVRDYIRFFGGDPRNIVASGQGSGASCASYLAFNNVARKHVKGIFAMSGTPVSPFTLDENEKRTANEVAELDGCNAADGVKFVRCMQALPLETIMKGDTGVENNRRERYDFSKEMSNLLTPGPAEEGKEDSRFLPHFLPETPLEAMKKGNFPRIPLLTGVTKDETGGGVKGNFLGEITKLLNPSFLQGGLLKDCLAASSGLFVNKTVSPSLSKLFNSGDYLQFFTTLVSSILSEIEQVVQHTTDAFFNLPAFITSHMWSQKNKVFLYSFEHKGQSHASNFLQGIPLVPASQTQEPSCNHGDDLMYLFELQSLEGQPMGNYTELSEADKKVKDHFVTMVAEFAKSGIPKTAGGESWEPFSKDNGNYMIIDEFPKLTKGFRKCSMALWTGDTNILSSAECGLGAASKIVTDTLGAAGTQLLETASFVEGRLGSAVGGVTTGLQNTEKKAVGALTNTTSGALNTLGLGGGNKGGGGAVEGQGGGGRLGIGGLLGGGNNNNKKPSRGGLLGLGK